MGYSLHPDFEPAAREAKAKALLDGCKPRLPEAGGGCKFPRSIRFVRDMKKETVLLPCGRCKVCRETALRSDVSVFMSEVATSNGSAMVTITYAPPMTLEEAQAEREADLCDPLLDPREREWRERNRLARVARLSDQAEKFLTWEHASAFIKRVNALGQRQGRDAVRAYKRDEVAKMVSAARVLFPRRSGELKRDYLARVARFRREARAAYMARPDRKQVEAVIRAEKGFKVRPWTAGQYGDEKGRAHFHLNLCFIGALPKSWPSRADGAVHRNVHLAQWPDGHADIRFDVSEKLARYHARYAFRARGGDVDTIIETPERVNKREVWSPFVNAYVPAPIFKRARLGGVDYARMVGAQWAKIGMMSPDFRVAVPGLRDQRDVYKRGPDGLVHKVKNGRAVMMRGPQVRAAFDKYREDTGASIEDLIQEASRRDYWAQERVAKYVRFYKDRDRRQNRVAYALDDSEALADEVARRRPSVKEVRLQAHDWRDSLDRDRFAAHVRLWQILTGAGPRPGQRSREARWLADDEAARVDSGERIRDALDTVFRSLGPVVLDGPERRAFLVAVAALKAGRVVFEGGEYVWRGDGPAPWDGLTGPPVAA